MREASLEVIRTEADRLSRLVGDLLDLARLDARRFKLAEEEVDLRQLLESAYNARTEEAKARGIAYVRDFDADPVLFTDGDRVLQIVTNLVDNAFVWTPDGGRIGLGLTAANGAVSVTRLGQRARGGRGGAGTDLPAVHLGRRIARDRARPRDRAGARAGARR